jgi:hypothetical protein
MVLKYLRPFKDASKNIETWSCIGSVSNFVDKRQAANTPHGDRIIGHFNFISFLDEFSYIDYV